jgi:hypothetical protein
MPLPALAIPAIAKSVPKWAWIGLGAIMLMAAFYFALHAYGKARYDAGKAAADAAWIEASNKLIAKSQAAGTKADKAAAARQADFAAKQEDEKEKIDAAVAEGSSPFDVLFGADGR